MEHTTLPPMREWIMKRRLSARFYALVLAGAGAAAAESLPSCSLDSLPLESGRSTLECVTAPGDTLFAWADQEGIEWGYQRIREDLIEDGVLHWGIRNDAALVPENHYPRREWDEGIED